MAEYTFPTIDESGNFTSPEVHARLDERYAGAGGGGAATLDELSDVSTTGATTGQALLFGADGQWRPGAVSSGDGGGVQSATVTRIVTSTDPDAPLQEGDLLIVVGGTVVAPPAGGASVQAWTPQTYGSSTSLTTISAAIPTAAQAGDLILVLCRSAYEPSLGGYTKVITSRYETTGMVQSTVFSAVATAASAGSTVTVSQPSGGRMALSVMVLRGPNGAAVLGSAAAVGNATTAHPIPTITAPKKAIAVSLAGCTYAGPGAISTWPAGWIQLTPGDTGTDNRSWVAHRSLEAGEQIPSQQVSHGGGSHEGSAVMVLVGAP